MVLRQWLLAGGLGLITAIAVASLLLRPDWAHIDFNKRAIALIAAEMPQSSPDNLTARTLPASRDSADRFVCVFKIGGAGSPDVYQVQFRRGLFGIQVNELYTPRWQPPRNGGIVRDDCKTPT